MKDKFQIIGSTLKSRMSRPVSALSLLGYSALIMPILLSLSVAQTFSVEHTFSAGDGAFPMAPVSFDRYGNLYGTTLSGTSGSAIYEINPAGAERVLHFLRPGQGTYTESGPVLDSEGNIYGTSSEGGKQNIGTVWELSAESKFVDLWIFGEKGRGGSYGAHPLGGLTRDAAGNLYGTSFYGGDLIASCGTLYKIGPGGTFTTLYNFLDAPDGCDPVGPLLIGKDGNLYGTTCTGGADGAGTLFKFDFSTGTETVLYNFTNGLDGGSPGAGLAQDSAGTLYGTTYRGGTIDAGTIFKFDLDGGVLSSLWSFAQNNTYGSYTYAGPVIDRAGNLYGTTYLGGSAAWGTVWELKPSGEFITLHSFTKGTDGGLPYAGVRLHGGSLYGTASEGGDPSCDCGVVYKITP